MGRSVVKRFAMFVLLVAYGGCGADPCDDEQSCMTNNEHQQDRQRQLFPYLNADYSKAFRLHSYRDNKCLQVAGFLVKSGQAIIGEQCQTGTTKGQWWWRELAGVGQEGPEYLLKNEANLCLSIQVLTATSRVVQYKCDKSKNYQRWRMQDRGSGRYWIRNVWQDDFTYGTPNRGCMRVVAGSWTSPWTVSTGACPITATELKYSAELGVDELFKMESYPSTTTPPPSTGVVCPAGKDILYFGHDVGNYPRVVNNTGSEMPVNVKCGNSGEPYINNLYGLGKPGVNLICQANGVWKIDSVWCKKVYQCKASNILDQYGRDLGNYPSVYNSTGKDLVGRVYCGNGGEPWVNKSPYWGIQVICGPYGVWRMGPQTSCKPIPHCKASNYIPGPYGLDLGNYPSVYNKTGKDLVRRVNCGNGGEPFVNKSPYWGIEVICGPYGVWRKGPQTSCSYTK